MVTSVDTYNIKISYPIDRSHEGEQGIDVHLLDPESCSLKMAFKGGGLKNQLDQILK